MNSVKIKVVITTGFIYYSSLMHASNYDQYAHENIGCPGNSICNKETGKKYKSWKSFIKNNRKDPDIANKLQKYINKFGIPLSFLTSSQPIVKRNGIYFESHCEYHNPPKTKPTFFKGMKFTKHLASNSTDLFSPVIVYSKNKKTSYQSPYLAHPYYLEAGSLIVPMEQDGYYYKISIDQNGKIKVFDKPAPKYLEMVESGKTTPCPKDSDYKIDNKFYAKSFCKNIWNNSSKKYDIVRLTWVCN